MAKKSINISRNIIPQTQQLEEAENKRIAKENVERDLELVKTSFYCSKDVWRDFKIYCMNNEIQAAVILNNIATEALKLNEFSIKAVELDIKNRQLVVFKIPRGQLKKVKVFCEVHTTTFRDIFESSIIKTQSNG